MSRSDRDGLSLMYRVGWRVRYVGLQVFGPAQLDGRTDPLERLKRERERKVADAREARSRG